MKKTIAEQTSLTWDSEKKKKKTAASMPKNPNFQKELLTEVKEGVKPSDLKRKLKRSKSADDITSIPVAPPEPLLTDQLKVKQTEIESLRQELEAKNTELTEANQALDKSLEARVEGIKQFGKVYDTLQQVKSELDETVDEASGELVAGDNLVNQLRTKLFTARQQISNLEKDLKLARIKRGTNLPDNSGDDNFREKLNYLRYVLYSLGTILFTLWLVDNLKTWQTEASLKRLLKNKEIK